MTFRILARSNIKDSMTFLMAEPPLRRPDQQRCQGDPAHRNVPARICTASEGIKLSRVHHGFPRAGAFGGGTHLGIPYPQMAERRAGGSGHLDGFRRRRGEVLRPDPGALLASRGPDDRVHTHCAPRHQACQRWRPVKGADSRSRARGRTKGESTARPRSYASARQRYTRGPRTPGVASRQTFRTGRIRP